MEQSEAVKNYLTKLSINFKIHKHPAVYTVEEADKYNKDVKGIHSKNLFLKNEKGKRFFLVILPGNKRLDFKQIENLLNEKLKFANGNDLQEKLKITTGAVSPFALIGNSGVELVIDKEVWESDFVSFHPCVNTETLELKGEDFKRFVGRLRNKILVIEIQN